MKQKQSLSFWQIFNMSFGFLGIQFGFALQNANVSRIFQTLGAKYQSEGTPVFELTDVQLGHTGTVLENQKKQREAFKDKYEVFSNDVISMIEYAESHAEVHA